MSRSAMFAASLACVLLAGCGDSGDAGGEGQTASAAGGMPSGWKATDACSIIDKAEMAEVTKAEVSEASLSLVNEPGAANAATSECNYLFAEGGRASVMTRWSPINDNTQESIDLARSTTASTMAAFTDKKIEDVPGVGKAAFFVPGVNQLNVFLDDARMIMVTLPSAPDATAKDQAIALVGKAS